MRVGETDVDQLRELVEDVREIRALFKLAVDLMPDVRREANAQNARGYGEGTANKTTSLCALLFAIDVHLAEAESREFYLTRFHNDWLKFNRGCIEKDKRAEIVAKDPAQTVGKAMKESVTAHRTLRRPKAKGRKTALKRG